MPTQYIDQFFVIDPGNAPPGGSALSVTKLNFVDQNDDNFIGTGVGDTVGGLTVTSVWVGDTITVVMNGVTQTITGVTFYRSGGSAVFTPTDGTVLTDATFQSSTWVNTSTQLAVSQFGPPCFVAGTRIATPDGPRPIETLVPGDLVLTRDNGPQPVRWIGRRSVPGRGRFAPIRFAPGAVGNSRALLVSPQHRMLLVGWQAELHFGQHEVLVAAKHLVDGDAVQPQPMDVVDYVHVLFDRHEVIEAEGAATESFHPGDGVLTGDPALRAEIAALFPEIAPRDLSQVWDMARPVARGREARAVAATQ